MAVHTKAITQLRVQPAPDHPTIPPKFSLKPYQRFPLRTINVNSSTRRLLAAHNTGSGKTDMALSVAQAYVNYHRQQTSQEYPIVYFMGYTRSLFIRQVLARPEYGFITQDELNYVARLRSIALNGTDSDKAALQDFETKLKRRLGNPYFGGHFRFYGYKEFFNLLFLDKEQLEPGKMVLNTDLLERMCNCLIICDEMHLLYNNQDANNYGLAIRTLGQIFSAPDSATTWAGAIPDDVLKKIKASTLYQLFLTATPMSTAGNVVDLFNIIISPLDIISRYPPAARRPSPIFIRDDFFDQSGKLLPSALKLIAKVSSGYVSYVHTMDPDVFPAREFIGVSADIPYFKFTYCKMPDALATLYCSIVKSTLPNGAEMLQDGAVLVGDKYYYQMDKLRELPKEKLVKAGVELLREENAEYIGGTFLRNNLSKCFPKYAELLRLVTELVHRGPGKIFISHQRVSGTGVLTIRDMFRHNGVLDMQSSPNQHTLCNVCAEPQGKHGKSHEFSPIRMIVIFGEMTRKSVDRSYSAYNAPSNLFGNQYRILIGSEKLNTSYDFAGIRYQIQTMPTDKMAEQLQLFGRSARNGSHLQLPPDQRKVQYFNLINYTKRCSVYDLHQYRKLLQDYAQTQQISASIYPHAVDSYVNADLLMRSAEKDSLLHSVPFKPQRPPFVYPKADASFEAFYAEQEIQTIMYIIKQLFVIDRVFSTIDLWDKVRNPGFATDLDPKSFDADNYQTALYRLLNPTRYRSTDVSYARLNNKYDPILLYKDTTEYRLIHTSKYYMSITTDDTALGPECWNRQVPLTRPVINLAPLLNISENYENLLSKFRAAYTTADWFQLISSLELYDESFHKRLVEDSVKTIFTAMVFGQVSEHFEFYRRMLYFYTKLDLIIYADQLQEADAVQYAPYINDIAPEPHINRFLQHSLTNAKTNFDAFSPPVFKPHSKKMRVPAYTLPVGHFIENWRIYHPQNGWSNSVTYNEHVVEVENDIVVGRYDKIPGSIELRFKLQKPVQKTVKHSDNRLNSRGIICGTENKVELASICTKLKLTHEGNSRSMCAAIKFELMQRELESRRTYRHAIKKDPTTKRVRWFYLQFE